MYFSQAPDLSLFYVYIVCKILNIKVPNMHLCIFFIFQASIKSNDTYIYTYVYVDIVQEFSNITYPWNIPQTQNQQFMKEFLSFGGLGRPGVGSRGMLRFS